MSSEQPAQDRQEPQRSAVSAEPTETGMEPVPGPAAEPPAGATASTGATGATGVTEAPGTTETPGTPETVQPPAGRPVRRMVALVTGVAVLALAVDLVTKILAAANLEGREPLRILGGLVYLQLIRNGGAAFGIATGMTWILALAAVAVVVAIIWLSRRLRSAGWAVALGLMLAGALGNLIDRIFRAPGPMRGHVVDFISLFAPDGRGWAVFNIADSCLTVGAVLIVLLTLLGKDYDGKSTKDKKAAERAGSRG